MASFIETIPSIVVSVVVTFLFLWVFYPAWAVLVAEQLEWDVEELSSSPDTADTHPCDESLPPLLSLVIPSYNEEDRIPIMIRESFGYLTSQRGKQLLRELQSCCGDRKTTSSVECDEKSNSSSSSTLEPKIEWIIVNDGSTDSTCDIVRATYQELMANKKGDNGDGGESASSTSCPTSSSAHANWKWKIVSLRENAGKGGAVKTGMNVAKGNFHLMVDADGATDFGSGLESLTRELKTHTQKVIVAASRNENNCDGTSSKAKAMTNSMVAVFGSRAHLEKDSTAQRSFVRTLLMKSFHFFVSLFVSTKVHDTQCGFKLFTKSASNTIFRTLHLRRWAFYTEIILLCDKQHIDMIEVGVNWKEIDGSKLSTSKLALAMVSISMLRDMICVRFCYTLGIWRVNNGV